MIKKLIFGYFDTANVNLYFISAIGKVNFNITLTF